MDDNTKTTLIANLIISKGKDVELISIPEHIKVDIYLKVGFKKVENGEIEDGLDILEKARTLGCTEDYVTKMTLLGVQLLKERSTKEGLNIIRSLQDRGYLVNLKGVMNYSDLTESARMLLKDNNLEDGFNILDIMIRDGDKTFIPRIAEIGYEKITHDQVDVGVQILRRIKEIGGTESIVFLRYFIYNNFKLGNIETSMRIIDEVKPFADNSYVSSVLEIGYQKILHGDAIVGAEIVKVMEGKGVDIDPEIQILIDD